MSQKLSIHRCDEVERFVTVLEISQAVSPETAVKVAIAAEMKGKK